MKKFFSKKILVVILLLLFIGGGAAAYLMVFKKSDSTKQLNAEQTEIKVDSLIGYIGSQSNYSKFNTLVGMFDFSKYLTKNESGLEPSLVIFAPNNNAFSKDDMKPFETLSADSKDKIKLYHMAKAYPDVLGAKPNLELVDGKSFQTLVGREITVKKRDNGYIVIDGKGREAFVDSKYATSSKGDRIYFIDNVLLFQ